MFLLICILVMWVMIFGVACFYFGSLDKQLTPQVIYRFTLAILMATLIWILGAYFFAFEGKMQTLMTVKSVSLERALDVFFQLCFCLYAVVMLIGAIIDRVKTSHLLLLVGVWISLVYTPLAYLMWNTEGLLANLGARDFSGGMVVHLSAGLSTYILAHFAGKTPHQHEKIRQEWLYLGMILVTFGWFGFNVGPVGQLNALAGQVLLNTLLAIVCGGFSWSLLTFLRHKEESTVALLNGMIVGLVTSTAGVGYLNTGEISLLTFVASGLTCLLTDYLSHQLPVDDVVDSFAMNGIGGFLGSLGLALLRPQLLLPQILAIFVTIFLSTLVSFVLGKALLQHKTKKVE
ncbi:ammonium transporter [Streptococcus dysgalactiae]|uniref:ammonium transporter n=1 Tax=Streptococcus dysgalactiae TaxID=1334 RepID=UPI003DA163D6